MTYSNEKEEQTNKFGRLDIVGSDNVKMANNMIYESVYSTTFWSRLSIQSTQSKFKLIRLMMVEKAK